MQMFRRIFCRWTNKSVKPLTPSLWANQEPRDAPTCKHVQSVDGLPDELEHGQANCVCWLNCDDNFYVKQSKFTSNSSRFAFLVIFRLLLVCFLCWFSVICTTLRLSVLSMQMIISSHLLLVLVLLFRLLHWLPFLCCCDFEHDDVDLSHSGDLLWALGRYGSKNKINFKQLNYLPYR